MGDDELACANCSGKLSAAKLRCSRCGQAYYCSPACQKQDWKKHKRGCAPKVSDGALMTEATQLGAAANERLRQGDAAGAIELLHKCKQCGERLGDAKQRARVLGPSLSMLGSAYSELGQLDRAIENHNAALAVARVIGDRRGERTVANDLGSAHVSLEQYAPGIEHFTQVLAISRELGDRSGEVIALGNLSTAYAKLGQHERAMEHRMQAEALSRELEAAFAAQQGEGAAARGDAPET